MRIRVYDDADEPAVIALWQAALADSAPHNDPATAIRMKVSFGRELFFVAENAGAVMGTAMGGYDGHRGWIYAVAVDPSARHQGVGTALVRRLEQELKARGCLKINLQVRTRNVGVIAFYETLGFAVDEVISMGKRLY